MARRNGDFEKANFGTGIIDLGTDGGADFHIVFGADDGIWKVQGICVGNARAPVLE